MATKASTFAIVDHAAFAAELQAGIGARFDGVVSRAAKEIGLSQPYLSRLLCGQREAVSLETLRKLRRIVPPGRRGHFDECVVPDAAQALLLGYRAWCERIRDRVILDEAPVWWMLENPERVPFPNNFARERELRAIAVHVIRQHPSYFVPLTDALRNGGHGRERYAVALIRILEPLIAGVETGFVERYWTELAPSELITFIKAGVAREVVLLDRHADVERARALVDGTARIKMGGPPVSIGADEPTRSPLLPWQESNDSESALTKTESHRTARAQGRD